MTYLIWNEKFKIRSRYMYKMICLNHLFITTTQSEQKIIFNFSYENLDNILFFGGFDGHFLQWFILKYSLFKMICLNILFWLTGNNLHSSEPYEISSEYNSEVIAVTPKVTNKKCPNAFKGIYTSIINLNIEEIIYLIYFLRHEI